MRPNSCERAPAKVNLYLHVVGRRADGYHLLDSLVVFAGACDVLHAETAGTLSLTLAGPFGGTLAAEPDNLVLRAARALGGGGARLTLEKHLPVASGIGGGSADAAAALRLLPRLWGTAPATPAQALALGADVPVCLGSTACRMGGVGEVLAPAPVLPACGLALVNPGAAVATQAVFRGRTGPFSPVAPLPAGWASAASMARDLGALGNDLEPAAAALCPSIADALAALRAAPGCLLARMSGSGATCFGLFETPAHAEAAAGLCGRDGWWVWGGQLSPA